jgi:hypothetical protein
VKRLALKAGARHSAADRADMQTLHDIAVKQGAQCAPMGNSRKAALIGRARALALELDDLERASVLQQRADRLRETDADRKARLLTDLERLSRDIAPTPISAPGVPTWKPFDERKPRG